MRDGHGNDRRGDGHGERWFDEEAGPVVRPYAVAKGRTLPSGGASFGLIDVVVATGEWPPRISGRGQSTAGFWNSAVVPRQSST